MGAVKQHFHEEICAMDQGLDGPEPSDAEMLAIDMARAIDRYIEAAVRDKAAGAINWNDAALASDKLSHFLEQTKAKRAA